MRVTPVVGLIPENSSNSPPNRSTGAPVTVFRFVAMGSKSEERSPRCVRIVAGTVVSCAPVSAQEWSFAVLEGLRDDLGMDNLGLAYADLSTLIVNGRVGLGMPS